MTHNQIDYWNYRENQRANLAKEDENQRHNVATETESHRANLVNEAMGWAHESEISRHNQAGEMIDSIRNAETQRHNQATEYENALHDRATEANAADANVINYQLGREENYIRTVDANYQFGVNTANAAKHLLSTSMGVLSAAALSPTVTGSGVKTAKGVKIAKGGKSNYTVAVNVGAGMRYDPKSITISPA